MTAMVLLSAWQSSQVEFWMPVSGYKGYDVSSFGRVHSWFRINGHPSDSPRIVGERPNRGGYRLIGFTFQGKRASFSVHRLVLRAFRGPHPVGKDKANHRNGCKADCRLENLEWCSQQENVTHCYEFLDPRILRGEEVGDSKFKECDIRQMRQWFADGLSQSEIGKRFKVPQGTIWRIVVEPYQAWKHVK